METILKHFPGLSPHQIEQLQALGPLYQEWNSKINVVSRKDIDNLYTHHILHSMAIGRFFPLPPGSRVLDIGTGGGFPGIPLAILFPETDFLLTDSIGKKIKVAQAVIEAVGIKNATAQNIRAEKAFGLFDFAVSRAVAPLQDLLNWAKPKIGRKHASPDFKNGLLVLKGGDMANELDTFSYPSWVYKITEKIPETFLEEKKLVYVPI